MTGGKYKYTLILTFFALLSFNACNSHIAYTDAITIMGKEWNIENILVFTPEIKDTIESNNIFFTIRTGSSYPYRNIYLFVSTTSPGGKTITDTLQYILADEKGKWFGKGFGDIHELDLPYKTGVYFPLRGTYSIKIQHGMRTEKLKGVYDFGLRIERAKNKV
jgi:gliding motility-associated lipoprotein GldH